jgi:UDP-glucose 4-epimerase
MRALVTGGAGFIGAHVCEALLGQVERVTVLDRLTTGRRDALRERAPSAVLVPGDVMDSPRLPELAASSDLIVHLAADPDVRSSLRDPAGFLREHHDNTCRLLASAKPAAVVVYASSSTVYGEPSQVPTPESYGPCVPISAYGASKLEGEALVASFSHLRGLRAASLRLANIVGEGQSHGVLVDLAAKLDRDPRVLEILGDGTQRKSYLDVRDAARAFVEVAMRLAGAPERTVETYNAGTEDSVDVKEIAGALCEAMRVSPEFRFNPVDEGRGWKGDVKSMLLDCSRLRAIGWEPRMGSAEAVRSAARWIASLRKRGERAAARTK